MVAFPMNNLTPSFLGIIRAFFEKTACVSSDGKQQNFEYADASPRATSQVYSQLKNTR